MRVKMVVANDCAEYFIIFEDEVLMRYSVHKIPGSYYRLTVYYDNSHPENIEFDPNSQIFRDYEGAHRPAKFREGYRDRQEDLRIDFLHFLGNIVGDSQRIQLKRGSDALQDIVEELRDIFEL
jgi:hypothetical protein